MSYRLTGQYLVVPGLPSIAWRIVETLRGRYRAEVLPSGTEVTLSILTVLDQLRRGELELRASWEAPALPARTAELLMFDYQRESLAVPATESAFSGREGMVL